MQSSWLGVRASLGAQAGVREAVAGTRGRGASRGTGSTRRGRPLADEAEAGTGLARCTLFPLGSVSHLSPSSL